MNKVKITKIKIKDFRSILSLDIPISQKTNFGTFCGSNNVGKTNILNALALFFKQKEFDPEKDCPNHKYYGSRGGHYKPNITIHFQESENEYEITKDWNLKQSEFDENKTEYKLTSLKNRAKLNDKETEIFLKKIHFFYLESINISFPETIKYIVNNDIIDMETENSRLRGKKGQMKEAIEKVLQDLQTIMDELGDSITPLLEKYKEGWSIAFDLPTEVNTFRDLMITEADFYIKDKSNSKAIDAKGSGLQRLSHILMYFRIVSKLNDRNESAIIAIDEPDVYLHSGLQKILLSDIQQYSIHNQIFITTHSPIFIDTVKLNNVFLLDQKIMDENKEYARRKGKTFNIVSTELVDLSDTNGITKLKKYLGIEDRDHLLFDKYNLIVEGQEDVIYLTKLMTLFGIEVPNIIPAYGADNIIKYLEFYNSIVNQELQSKFLIILDNDQKGREIFKKIKSNRFQNITVQKKYIISFSGYEPKITANGDCHSNIEIEDFIKPALICNLVNQILKSSGLIQFSKRQTTDIVNNIQRQAFQDNGILNLLENKKNEINPDHGHKMKIHADSVKKGIAALFDKLDSEIITLVGDADDPENINIVNFLRDISGKPRDTLF